MQRIINFSKAETGETHINEIFTKHMQPVIHFAKDATGETHINENTERMQRLEQKMQPVIHF